MSQTSFDSIVKVLLQVTYPNIALLSRVSLLNRHCQSVAEGVVSSSHRQPLTQDTSEFFERARVGLADDMWEKKYTCTGCKATITKVMFRCGSSSFNRCQLYICLMCFEAGFVSHTFEYTGSASRQRFYHNCPDCQDNATDHSHEHKLVKQQLMNSFEDSVPILGKLVGVGGFCSVYELGGISSLVVKVATGGKSIKGSCDCDVDDQEKLSHQNDWYFPCLHNKKAALNVARPWPTLSNVDHSAPIYTKAFYHWTSTYIADLMSTDQVQGLLLAEFRLLLRKTMNVLPHFACGVSNKRGYRCALVEESAARPRPTRPRRTLGAFSIASLELFSQHVEAHQCGQVGSGDQLYPRPLGLCAVGNALGYVMERIRGETLRDMINHTHHTSKRKRAKMRKVDGSILLQTLIHCMKGHLHGDIKPDNIIFDGTLFRLIDPAAVADYMSSLFRDMRSFPYGLVDAWDASADDPLSLALVTLEMVTGEALFRSMDVASNLVYSHEKRDETVDLEVKSLLSRFKKVPLVNKLSKLTNGFRGSPSLAELCDLLAQHKLIVYTTVNISR